MNRMSECNWVPRIFHSLPSKTQRGWVCSEIMGTRAFVEISQEMTAFSPCKIVSGHPFLTNWKVSLGIFLWVKLKEEIATWTLCSFDSTFISISSRSLHRSSYGPNDHKSSSTNYQLCDFGQKCNSSKPQFPHLQNQDNSIEASNNSKHWWSDYFSVEALPRWMFIVPKS